MCRLTTILFSFIFAGTVLAVFSSDRLYSASLRTERTDTARSLSFVDAAIKLDPINAELYFEKAYLLKRQLIVNEQRTTINEKRSTINEQQIYERCLHLYKRCINLSPSWPQYHLYYALILNKMGSNYITREFVRSELEKAAELKPYSKMYQEMAGKD